MTHAMRSLAVVVMLLSCGIAAQQRPAAIRRTADGKPDLSGVWVAGTQPLLLGEQESARLRAADAAAGRPAFRREPPPYKPEFEAKRLEFVARRGVDDPMARCLLSGVPRVTTRPLPFQIVQTKDLVVILYEAHHAFRIIPTDGRPHPDDLEPSYLGDSIGRWDGDTLVVDVTGQNDQTWFDRSGNFHSDAMRVVERYTRTSADVMSYEATIDDPKVFTRPWKMSMPLYRRQERNAQLMDFKCVEFVEELLYGQWRKRPLSR